MNMSAPTMLGPMRVVDPMADAVPIHSWIASRPCYAGVDPSLTRTGVSIMGKARIKTFVLVPPKSVGLGVGRLIWFREQFVSIFTRYAPAGLALEGYSYGSLQSHSHSLGELGGVLRMAAHDCRLHFIAVPPNSLKLFATGSGQAVKGVVLKEAYKRWGIDVRDDNEADAGVLSLMAHAHFGTVADLPAFQQKALSKIGS